VHKLVRFDWAIKNILRQKANFGILEGFLSELLEEPVHIHSLLESESNSEEETAKFNRVDLLVETQKKQKIIIEVQTATEWDYWHRILFGTSKIVTEYIEKGQPYSAIPKVISISILLFNLGEGTDYLYKGETEFKGLRTHESLAFSETDKKAYLNFNYHRPQDIYPTYYLIQLKRFKNIIQNGFDEWVYLLKNEAVQEGFKAQGIDLAKKRMDLLQLSEKEKRAYDSYMESVSLEASLIQTREVELAAVQAVAMEKSKKEVALRMLSKNMPADVIADMTGLTLNEIAELKER
jgi:predicted transposase/invertase (TIGR01784 family)